MKNKNFENKKGVILTIDAIIAVTLVTLILVATSNYVVSSRDDVLPELQLVRTGNDILALLAHLNEFEETATSTSLHNAIRFLLPPNYEMRINVKWNTEDSIELIENMPDDRFIGAGERVFVTENLNFGIARFWIWAKN